MTEPKRFHLLPTATKPHQPGIWDNGDGTFTIYPQLTPKGVRRNRQAMEAQDQPRFLVTPPNIEAGRIVAGIQFHGFSDLTRNRYAAVEIVTGLEAAISLAKWLDCSEYGVNDWPWARDDNE